MPEAGVSTSPLGAPSLHEFVAGLSRSPHSKSPLLRWLARYVAGQRCVRPSPVVPSPAAMAAASEAVFPSPLPFPDAEVPTKAALGSRRRKRELEHRRAERWANRLFGVFSFWEAGCPRDADRVQAALAPLSRVPSELQLALAANVKEDILPFCRLGSPAVPGRGGATLQGLLDNLSFCGYSGADPTLPLAGALPVLPGRISLPTKAGTIRPSEVLCGERRKVFEDLAKLVAPSAPPPPSGIRACHLLTPQHERAVLAELFAADMIVLVPEEEVPRDAEGGFILGGLFCVPHKSASERLINDRRPQNFHELLLSWESLPHGSQLGLLVPQPDEIVRGSGDDLQNFYYLVEHSREWIPRNCFGRRLRGDDYLEYGGAPGRFYRAAFRVLCMGDCNGVSLAQAIHEAHLVKAGCLLPSEHLRYHHPVPQGKTLEGVYIDDHLVVQMLLRSDHLRGRPARDDDLLDKSRSSYAAGGFPRSIEKSFTKLLVFKAWGTEVHGETGRVGSPLEQLVHLAGLIVVVLQLPRISRKLMQKLVGLINHPLNHRRELLAVFHEFLDGWNRYQRKLGCLGDERRGTNLCV